MDRQSAGVDRMVMRIGTRTLALTAAHHTP
jgi:hypothetical protein